MKHGKAKWGFIVVGAVAVLALGAIGVAGAAGNDSTATPAPSSSAQAGQGPGLDGDGDGPHGGMLEKGGPGDLAEALATLSGKDEATIVQQRAAGKSFAEIAKGYGVSESDLLAEATRIETAELDAAVEAGQITKAQRTQYLAGLQARLEAAIASTDAMPAGGPGRHGGPGGHHGRFGGGGDLAEALATLSGKDEATIMQQRAAGKSFAEIAKGYGVSESDLLAAATRIETAELEAAVAAGQLTEAQKAEILAGLQAHLEEELTETHALGGPGGHLGDRDDSGSGATDGATASPGTETSYLTY